MLASINRPIYVRFARTDICQPMGSRKSHLLYISGNVNDVDVVRTVSTDRTRFPSESSFLLSRYSMPQRTQTFREIILIVLIRTEI